MAAITYNYAQMDRRERLKMALSIPPYNLQGLKLTPQQNRVKEIVSCLKDDEFPEEEELPEDCILPSDNLAEMNKARLKFLQRWEHYKLKAHTLLTILINELWCPIDEENIISQPTDTDDNQMLESISFVVLGPFGTIVSQKELNRIDWSKSNNDIVRKMLLLIFGEDTLATHNLTGYSKFFKTRNQLDQRKIEDLQYFMLKKSDMDQKAVRSVIANFCKQMNYRKCINAAIVNT